MRKDGLSQKAYVPIAEGDTYDPFVSPDESPAEFTFKAIFLGILFGIIFGAANAYLGLRAGLTISTSIPVAVMTVAVFRALRGVGIRGTILETNISQTTGSASSSLASGVIFTLPALFMWGMPPELLQMTLLAMCGGLLGILFMIPLRRFLIEREHGGCQRNWWWPCALCFLRAGWRRVLQVPDIVDSRDSACHPRQGAVPEERRARYGSVPGSFRRGLYPWAPDCGGVIDYWGADLTAPFYPETVNLIRDMSPSQIWTRYVRYIGAGAVATAGIITLIRSIPVMVSSFKIGSAELSQRMSSDIREVKTERTGADLPLRVVGIGVLAIAAVLVLVPQVFGAVGGVEIRTAAAICVVVFAFFFVTVASRIVGLVGVTSNPTSGMTIAALLGTASIFLLFGWTDTMGKAAALTVGCVVAIAASISGDTSQDLKTGFLLGATPRRQQTAELIGVLTSAVFVCLTVLALGKGFGFGSTELPAPQATLMKLVIDGVLDQNLPWALVAIGAGIAIVCEIARIPSLPFAVGVYLPVSTMTPIFVGGLIRLWMERKAKDEEQAADRRERGVLLGSGFVGGEGLLGVGIALVAVAKSRRPDGIGTEWLGSEVTAMIVGAIAFALFATWFFRLVRGSNQQ
jgi:uncharacterized oligopeptide transporter (OPT) family protein